MAEQEQVVGKVAVRKIVNKDGTYVDQDNPFQVEIAGSTGSGILNTLDHGKLPDDTNSALSLDSTGALIVTGAGAEPSATSLKLQDATETTQHAAVDANGQVSVTDTGTQTKLDSILAQLDDATADTVLSILKDVLTELGQKVEASDLQTDALTDDELRATPVAIDDEALLNKLPNDIFGHLVMGSRHNQIEVSFFEGDPDSLTDITTTTTGSGYNDLHEGHGHFNTGTGTNGEATAETVETVTYRPLHEVYAAFTAAFTSPVAEANQRIGLYNDNEGFFIGYEGTQLQVTHRTGGVDTAHVASSWDHDPLDGSADSKFTRDGVPEALDWTLTNVFRIRFGWLGSADVRFEVLSPDGDFITFHVIHFPNLNRHPSVQTPNLPIRLEAIRSGGSADIEVATGCWAGGTTADDAPLTETVNDRTLASLVRAVITAEKPNGDYINIAANNKGRLLFALGSVGDDGATAPTEVNQVGGVDGSGNLQALSVDSAGVLDVADASSETLLQDVKRAITDYETRLDYDTRTDANPVYVGKAAQGTATATASWTVQKLTYDSSDRLTRAQVLDSIAWDNRTTAGWS